MTPLHLLCKNSTHHEVIDIAKKMINKGANVNAYWRILLPLLLIISKIILNCFD